MSMRLGRHVLLCTRVSYCSSRSEWMNNRGISSLFVWLWLVVNDSKFLAETVFFSHTNQPAVLLHEPATIRTSQPNRLCLFHLAAFPMGFFRSAWKEVRPQRTAPPRSGPRCPPCQILSHADSASVSLSPWPLPSCSIPHGLFRIRVEGGALSAATLGPSLSLVPGPA